jgi:hypothetical protein
MVAKPAAKKVSPKKAAPVKKVVAKKASPAKVRYLHFQAVFMYFF